MTLQIWHTCSFKTKTTKQKLPVGLHTDCNAFETRPLYWHQENDTLMTICNYYWTLATVENIVSVPQKVSELKPEQVKQYCTKWATECFIANLISLFVRGRLLFLLSKVTQTSFKRNVKNNLTNFKMNILSFQSHFQKGFKYHMKLLFRST